MTEEWRISLFRARKQLIAFILLVGALVVVAGLVTLGSLLWNALNSSESPNPASQQFSNSAKIQAVSDGLSCLKLGAQCADFDHTTAYLSFLIMDSAEFTSGPQATRLTKNADGWKAWALTATKDTAGPPTAITEAGSTVTFTWGSHRYTATFVSTGHDSRLTKLSKGNDVP